MAVLIERQRRLVEVGIIRVGDPKPNDKQPGRPRKTFRITSAHKNLLELAQAQYGGEVTACENPKGHYQLAVQRDQIKALISLKEMPNGDFESFSQYFEEWKGGTCARRCDGRTVDVWKETGKDKQGRPVHDRVKTGCMCDPDARDCKLVSRVSVILPEVPALGLWRLNTQSTTFDNEFQGLIATIQALGIPSPVPVLLSISTREGRKGPGEQNSKFPVVQIVLDPNPVSLPAMIEGIRRSALAMPESLGDVPVLEPPKYEDDEPEPVDAEIVMSDSEWLDELIGVDSARDWRTNFEGMGKDFAGFVSDARKREVDAEKFHKSAARMLEVVA